MPVMSGWEFLKEVREHDRWRAIPTLVFTGLSTAERRREELGSLPVFVKPFNFDQLLAALRPLDDSPCRVIAPAPRRSA
jgi:DNA-binding response OmpR family regulator